MIYTSNGAGDVLYCKDDACRTEIETVAKTGDSPKAAELARLLQSAHDRGRASMAEDIKNLLGVGQSNAI